MGEAGGERKRECLFVQGRWAVPIKVDCWLTITFKLLQECTLDKITQKVDETLMYLHYIYPGEICTYI